MKHPTWMTREDCLPVAHVWPHMKLRFMQISEDAEQFSDCYAGNKNCLEGKSNDPNFHDEDDNPAPAGDGRPMCVECLLVQDRLEREWEAKYGKWEGER